MFQRGDAGLKGCYISHISLLNIVRGRLSRCGRSSSEICMQGLQITDLEIGNGL
jgi:hypothetical protein